MSLSDLKGHLRCSKPFGQRMWSLMLAAVCQHWMTERLLKVTGRHVHCDSGIISEVVQDRHVVILQTTNRKCHKCLLNRAIWDDFKVIRLLQGLQMEFVEELCNTWHGFNWQRVARSIGDSWASCILTYNDRTVTHLHIKWGVAVGPTVIGAGTRHLPPSRIHAPVTNPR